MKNKQKEATIILLILHINTRTQERGPSKLIRYKIMSQQKYRTTTMQKKWIKNGHPERKPNHQQTVEHKRKQNKISHRKINDLPERRRKRKDIALLQRDRGRTEGRMDFSTVRKGDWRLKKQRLAFLARNRERNRIYGTPTHSLSTSGFCSHA